MKNYDAYAIFTKIFTPVDDGTAEQAWMILSENASVSKQDFTDMCQFLLEEYYDTEPEVFDEDFVPNW